MSFQPVVFHGWFVMTEALMQGIDQQVRKHHGVSTFYPTRIDGSFVFPTGDINKTVFWGNSKM